jgi:hypothetical protein
MPSGGPGDHPLTDILRFNLDVYSKTCDSLIREISKFVSVDDLFEMFDWFNISPDSKSNVEEFELHLKAKLNELKEKAKNDGWEI